ncbi:TORTIFOLIA1-like protein 2 [Chlorella vulgaris]
MPPADARAVHYARQDLLFGAMERLEAKDTQLAAFETLKRQIKDLDVANLSALLHAAGSRTSRTGQFFKIHALRLAALCTTALACLQWRAMLQPPLLGKLLSLLGAALRDGDSAVRAAAAECCRVVAAQLAAVGLATGDMSNPLLACLLEALAEPSGLVQAAAATALAQTAEHLQPLQPALLRQLLQALNNPSFLGRPELWQALAWLDGGRLRGLAASSWHLVLDLMPEVLGSAADGTGLLGALSGRGKDFQLRAAAAHTIKALAAGVGPSCPAGWDAAAAALKAAKTDVSKPVRDAATSALPLVACVQQFSAGGLPLEQWPAMCSGILAAELRNGVRELNRGKPGPRDGGEAGELHIRAVHLHQPERDQMHQQFMMQGSMPAATAPASLADAAHVLSAAHQQESAVHPTLVPVAPVLAQPCLPRAQHASGTQLAVLLEQQARLAADFANFAAATQHQLQQLGHALASTNAAVAQLSAAGGRIMCVPEAHLPAAALLGTQTGQQRPRAAPRLSSLHRTYHALEQDLHSQQRQQQQQPPGPAAVQVPGQLGLSNDQMGR